MGFFLYIQVICLSIQYILMKFLSVVAFAAALGLSVSTQFAEIKVQPISPFPQQKMPIQDPFHPSKPVNPRPNVFRQDVQEIDSTSQSESERPDFWPHEIPQRPEFDPKNHGPREDHHKRKIKQGDHQWRGFQEQERHGGKRHGLGRAIFTGVLITLFITMLCCLVKRCKKRRHCRGGMKEWAMSDTFIDKQINLHHEQIRRLEQIKARRRIPAHLSPIVPANYIQQERISYGEPRNMHRQYPYQVPTGRPMNQFEREY